MIYLVRKELQFENQNIILKDNDFRYIVKVRRIRRDEPVFIFSKDEVHKTFIDIVDKRSVSMRIKESAKIEEPSRRLYLVLAMADMPAVELALKNGIEAGVNDIFIFDAERSNTRSDKVEHRRERIEQILESAASQSRRRYLPSFRVGKMSDLMEKEGLHIVFHPYGSQEGLDTVENRSGDVYVWIGPEGGFSDIEVEKFKEKSFTFVPLTTPILRMENAVTLACGKVREKMGYNSELFQSEQDQKKG